MLAKPRKSKDFKSESRYALVKIPRNRIQKVWGAVSPYLEIGLTVAPELSMERVIAGLIDESYQLWVVLRDRGGDEADLMAAYLTAIERDKGEWVVSLFALGGIGAKDWLGVCDATMGQFARDEGAVRIRMCGRKAWIRLLPESFAITGVRQGHFVYERDVDPQAGQVERVAKKRVAAAQRHAS